MQRFKIFVGSMLLLLVFILLAPSFTKADTPNDSKHLAFKAALKETAFNKDDFLRYRSKQKELKSALTAYFKKAIASGDIVGAGVSIVHGDSILISEGFGKRSANRSESVNGETLFRLGSLSKGFAGVLAAQIKHEGKLNWNDRVSDYLPDFRLGDKNNTEHITLANILSHTSGTPYHSFTNLVEAGLPLSDIASRFGDIAPISEPGMLYSYQNAMFALCGEMMSRATGQKINTLLNDRLFTPLGMCTTTMDHESLMAAANIAMPHVKVHNGWRSTKLRNNYYNAIAAGGISSTAHDMARWMRFLLGNSPEIMEASAIGEAFNPFVKIGGYKYYKKWPGHVASYYGFGWRIHKYEDQASQSIKTIWHHGGSVNNYRNEIGMYPEDNLGICVLLNGHSRIAKNVVPDLNKIVREVYSKNFNELAFNHNSDHKVSLH